MAKQTIATIKAWFVTNAKPLQQQFADWLDSFRHKDDKIAMTDLTVELQNKINTAGGGDTPDLSGYVKTTDKGAANGVASLGNDGKVPTSQLPVGQKGDQGLSAFQVWVAQGNPNDVNAFFEALKGLDGKDGDDGQGIYQLAVAHGFTGSETDFIASLKGAKGADGRSAYQVWIDNGNSGSVGDFLASLKGAKGDVGASTWATLQNKPTTIDGFGITDVYTMSQVDAKTSSVYRPKGSLQDYTKLPTSGQQVGDVYNIVNAGGGYNAGDNVVWTADGWDPLAGVQDVSGKQDRSEKSQPNGYAGLNANGQLTQPMMPFVKQVVNTLSEGGTVNIGPGMTDVVIDISSTILNATIVLPQNPVDNQECRIWFGGSIASLGNMVVNNLSIDGNGKTIVSGGAPTVIVSGDMLEYIFVNNYWREM